MNERLYFERPDVYVLAEYNDHHEGRGRLVVCEHPAGASFAERLAVLLGIPLQHNPHPGPHAAAPEPPPGPG